MIAIASLFIVVSLALLVTRLAALALTATGVPTDVARFQARSAFTGVGFTTSESESIVGHPVRRRIVLLLMTVGNAGFVTIMATLVLSFTSSSGSGDALARLVLILGVLSILAYMTKTSFFENRITGLLRRALNRYTDLELRDFQHMMQLSGDYAVVELAVRAGDWVAGKSLAELELPDEGLLVLAVQGMDGGFLGAPRGQTIVDPGDTLVLYGRTSVVADIDTRPDSPRGDRAHEQAVAEQEEILLEAPEEQPPSTDNGRTE